MFEGTTFYSNMQTLSRFFDIFVDEQPLHLYTLHYTLAALLPPPPSPHTTAHTKYNSSLAKQPATSCQYVSIAKALTSIFLPISCRFSPWRPLAFFPPSFRKGLEGGLYTGCLKRVEEHTYSHSTFSLITLAGFPATKQPGGTSRVTTLPAPTMAPSPMVTPFKMMALRPIHT